MITTNRTLARPRILRRAGSIARAALLAALLAPAAGPAGAQGREPRETTARCVQLGTALAVVSADALVADVLAPAATAARGGASAIVTESPIAIAACAGLSAFWSGPRGPAGAEVSVWRAPIAAGDAPLARDGALETRGGPSQLTDKLAAGLTVDQPGLHSFVARLTVSAGLEGGAALEETVDTPFTVELRVKPAPGSIEGLVVGSDGLPLAGARVVARARPAFLAGLRLEVQGEGAPDDGERGASAVTGADGRYSIRAHPGAYAVSAEARGHKAQWFDRKATAAEAASVTVAAGAATGGVDFALAAAERDEPRPTSGPRPTREPDPGRTPRATDAPRPTAPAPETARIEGLVLDASGAALEGQLVVAQPPAGLTVGEGRTTKREARTGPDGRYALVVPTGRWQVQAGGQGHAPLWFPQQADRAAAEVLELAKDQVRTGVDFSLARLPHGRVTGRVLAADGAGAAGVKVRLLQRDAAGAVAAPELAAGYVGGVTTGRDGAYTALVPPGDWLVQATSGRDGRARFEQWWNGKATAAEADALTLVDGQEAAAIDFQMP